ncbi:MAG: hypothetical protein L0287_22435 [Anaerolineae bacterium]|nr:hypothetical protein [Anaerolineae bacterium]
MKTKIPLWINIFQVLIILILSFQALALYFNPELQYPGINIDGVADQLSIYELAGRTATMAIVSMVVLLSQNPKFFVIGFVMNFLREFQETFIDPLYPLANAPISPIADFLIHVFVLVIPELIALAILYKLSKQLDKQTA